MRGRARRRGAAGSRRPRARRSCRRRDLDFGCVGHGASAGASVAQPRARAACAASTATTSEGSARGAASTASTHSSSGTQRVAMSASSSSRAMRFAVGLRPGRGRSGSPRCCRPGVVQKSMSTAHSDASRSASSASSRCAPSSGRSPSMSSSPAGISQSRLRTGCRYCWISSARSSSSSASTATAPGWST